MSPADVHEAAALVIGARALLDATPEAERVPELTAAASLLRRAAAELGDLADELADNAPI